MKINKPQNARTVICRGLIGQCPNCGKKKLFISYLKQLEKCLKCNEQFGHIRCDDGPAWLTILIVAHFLALFLFTVAIDSSLPDWVAMVVLPCLATILILIILPRSKGLFIAMIWWTNCVGAER